MSYVNRDTKRLSKLEQMVSAWPQISVHPHRFGGSEFRFGRAELGHVHENGVVDIPFPTTVRDVFLSTKLAEEHHFIPDSGWITFRMRTEEDLEHAIWLFRLSYLRYALKSAPDPRKLLKQESAALQLSPQLESLFEALVPANHANASSSLR